jgi:hypothetical protein
MMLIAGDRRQDSATDTEFNISIHFSFLPDLTYSTTARYALLSNGYVSIQRRCSHLTRVTSVAACHASCDSFSKQAAFIGRTLLSLHPPPKNPSASPLTHTHITHLHRRTPPRFLAFSPTSTSPIRKGNKTTGGRANIPT